MLAGVRSEGRWDGKLIIERCCWTNEREREKWLRRYDERTNGSETSVGLVVVFGFLWLFGVLGVFIEGFLDFLRVGV